MKISIFVQIQKCDNSCWQQYRNRENYKCNYDVNILVLQFSEQVLLLKTELVLPYYFILFNFFSNLEHINEEIIGNSDS